MRITIKDVEEKIKPLGNRLSYDKEFIFELLTAYGRAQGNITRLRNGQLNVANDKANEVAQKGIVYFKSVSVSDDVLYVIIDDLKTDPTVVRYSTRFVIVTNYDKLLAIDTRTGEPLDISIREIDQHYAYFLPWAGMEKAQFVAENHADVKAAEKMAKLFDILVAHNRYTSADEWHTLTIFFTRLLFCFFAEDTNIFSKNQFVNAVASYTQEDGSDLKDFLHTLFDSLDANDKSGYPAHLAAFPYVNGRLFSDFTDIPGFNKQARDLLLESASKLDWSDINPDIFGSMFQAVVQPGERTGLGQHYTSVPNIMKTIEPLFLDDLRNELNNSYDDTRKLEKLLARISNIKVFDPACGSGNFLIIAYKELRRLEHAILERQAELTGQSQQAMFGSRVNIENFYGIEIDDFPHEVAILSLWLAKHQMNLEFTEKFGIDLPLIPLKESGNIVHANAARIDWDDVCPNSREEEVYLVGNPPYMGAKLQDASQKKDYEHVFKDESYSKNLDYIALWFIKGARYVAGTNAQLAFVTTNSVSQGDHVGLMYPKIFELDLEIGFSHPSFKWENNAKGSAGVTVSVINLRNSTNKPKYLFEDGVSLEVNHINPYLAASSNNTIIHGRKRAISNVPSIVSGSMPRDGGNLILTPLERTQLIEENSLNEQYIKRYVGSREFLYDEKRFCIWLDSVAVSSIEPNGELAKRIDAVRSFRSSSKAPSTQKFGLTPHKFAQISFQNKPSIIIPLLSSEKREYFPMGFEKQGVVTSNLAFAVYNAPMYLLGILHSRMHMCWIRAVGGKMETRLRYSVDLVYNNFPTPALTEAEKAHIEEKAFSVLDARESHPEKTLAEMYDPDKMPDDLRTAHHELDEAVDAVYRKKPFTSDEERLAHLFDLYETMTANERKKS